MQPEIVVNRLKITAPGLKLYSVKAKLFLFSNDSGKCIPRLFPGKTCPVKEIIIVIGCIIKLP